MQSNRQNPHYILRRETLNHRTTAKWLELHCAFLCIGVHLASDDYEGRAVNAWIFATLLDKTWILCVCVLNVHSFSLSETEHNFIHLREIYWLSYKPLGDDVSLFSHGAIVLGWIFKSLVLRNFLEMWILKILPQVLFVLLFQFCLYFFPPYWHANVLTPISSCLLWLRTVSTFVNAMLLGSLQRNPSILFCYFDVLFLTHFWIYLQFILVYDVSDGFSFIFSLLAIQLFQHQLLKHSFFPLLIRAVLLFIKFLYFQIQPLGSTFYFCSVCL